MASACGSHTPPSSATSVDRQRSCTICFTSSEVRPRCGESCYAWMRRIGSPRGSLKSRALWHIASLSSRVGRCCAMTQNCARRPHACGCVNSSTRIGRFRLCTCPGMTSSASGSTDRRTPLQVVIASPRAPQSIPSRQAFSRMLERFLGILSHCRIDQLGRARGQLKQDRPHAVSTTR